MNYQKHYDALICKAKNRKSINCYTEKHHIIPKCLGGNDDKSNIAILTAEEHYVAHQLLVKLHPDNKKILHAAICMTCHSKSNASRITNKIYGWLRRRLSVYVSNSQKGSSNSQYNTQWIFNVEQEKSLKVSKRNVTEYLQIGWKPGRIIDFDLHKKQNRQKERIEKEKEMHKIRKSEQDKSKLLYRTRIETIKNDTQKLYQDYMSNDTKSLREFAKQQNMNVMTLSKRFTKHIPGYTENSKARISLKRIG